MGDDRRLNRLIISAPFGNYIQPSGATPTLGTFTRRKRPGRLWRIVRTVRYYRRLGAWVNRIGLRNPGIDWLEARHGSGKVDASDKLVSIHGFEPGEWWELLDACARIAPLGIELNISCPNVGDEGGMSWPEGLFARAVEAGASCGSMVIVKLPPVRYETMLEAALDAGVSAFHCCNTLPVKAGGMSGAPLKPLSLRCVAEVRAKAAKGATIIGGGGITNGSDIDEYAQAGADRIALGTKTMHPKYLLGEGDLRGLIEHAERVLGAERGVAERS
jgi:dihydroorotate dehydrogenase